MRNFFLALLLANLLLLAWNLWINPQSVPTPGGSAAAPGLQLFGQALPAPPGREAAPMPMDTASPSVAAQRPGVQVPTECLRIGPFPSSEAAAELASSLADRDLPAAALALEGQIWVGNWVQVGGFRNTAEAEIARGRLVAGGLADALLVQDGALPVISLGVFREQERADRVMAAAKQLGFRPVRTDRYRPGTEHWVVVGASAGQPIAVGALGIPGAKILRAEPYSCGALGPVPEAMG